MYRVIIADDEPKVLLLIRNLIRWDELGLELVATASDGISALALIEEHQPDVVITDIRMPGYDGIELIGRATASVPQRGNSLERHCWLGLWGRCRLNRVFGG